MGRIVIVLVSLLVCRFSAIVYAQLLTYASENCETNHTVTGYIRGSVYEKNLKLLYNNMISKSSSVLFYNDTVGTDSDKVYVLFQCRYDLTLSDCKKCVTAVGTYLIQECSPAGAATVWYYECVVRYSRNDIFSFLDMDPIFIRRNTENVSNSVEFVPILKCTLIDLNDNASSFKVHSARNAKNWANTGKLYSYAQCTPDIDQLECMGCLKTAFAQLIDCCSVSIAASVFTPSCQLRYDTTGSFLYSQSSPAEAPFNQAPRTSKKTSLKPAIIAVIAAGAVVGLLALSAVFWVCKCSIRRKEAIIFLGKSDSEGLRDSEFTQYDFATLKVATRDFSIKNKLGEGGFGSVYKGTLENGELLAIKRLSGTSGQGTTEFMTEARFLAKLQHKNLVKLGGFCLEGEEKLLVYEFMPNASLDRFLFGDIWHQSTWKQGNIPTNPMCIVLE